MLKLGSSRWLALPLLALGVVGVLSVAAPGEAQERPGRTWRPPTATWASVSVGLEDEAGQPLRTFMHHGQTFALGEFGQRYNIRVRNPLPRRVEVVVSVDGRDVVNGKKGDFVNNRGYVIGPNDSLLIEGFRTSLSEVAAFRFTDPSDSYSARMGTPQNVGVIGVAFFGERVEQEIARERRPVPRKKAKSAAPQSEPSASGSGAGRTGGGGPAPGAKAPERSAQNIGTQFGESMESRVGVTTFERETPRTPSRLITLRYDDAEGLQARGIDVFGNVRRVQFEEPQAFPDSRFAPAPPR